MDYQNMAGRLLDIWANMPQVQAERRLSKMIVGENFALNYLASNNNEAYPKDLSKSMMVSTARIAAILKQLERDGLITRTADAQDNRQVIVRLTDEGAHLIEKDRAALLDGLTKMLEYLGPEDAEAYIRIRKKLLQMALEK
ncbi:MarR family winged helix-turn-helix transcriptional regulator [Caproiciproducens sp.]